ncbi:hypothetical protein [Oculatella sp. LEGE 06141]|uniref:hypothetical protein n=1 Tax=Oculatella sp. LEGE 06141 TaxID=1828648 RepID=UPI00187E14FF|nr:hypothetical protein [Oculatella sp. LEGE 06141]
MPHRIAINALGATNDYQVRKHYPKLTIPEHYFKLRGRDHVDRIFYTLKGLVLLCDLIGTEQARQFKSILEHRQSAIVQGQEPTLYFAEASEGQAVYAEIVEDYITPSHPKYELVRRFQPDMEPVDQATAQRESSSHVSENTAAMIFEAQRIAQAGVIKPQDTAEMIFKAQQLVSEQIFKGQSQQQNAIHAWKRFDSWLNQQEIWAFALFCSMCIALLGIGSYLCLSLLSRNSNPSSHNSSQVREQS